MIRKKMKRYVHPKVINIDKWEGGNQEYQINYAIAIAEMLARV
jgi:hypothetical protein